MRRDSRPTEFVSEYTLNKNTCTYRAYLWLSGGVGSFISMDRNRKKEKEVTMRWTQVGGACGEDLISSWWENRNPDNQRHLPPSLVLETYTLPNLPAAAAKSLQSCLTLCDPIDGSPPGPVVPGILQARALEWVAISFSNAWKWKVKVKSLSCVWLLATPWTAAYQAPLSMGFSRQEYWSGLPLPSPDFYLAFTKIPNKAEHRRLGAFKLWCWRRLLRVPLSARRSNQSILRKSTLNIHWKNWCWSWNCNTLTTWCEEPIHWKRPGFWERMRAGGEGVTGDQMVGWHHQLNGHEFEQTPGDNEGHRSLVCCCLQGLKELDTA